MGIYVNPNNIAFLRSLNSEPYIDKSGLISVLNQNVNTNHANICVSRPRRFGKSMAVDMAVAYYSKGCDSRNLFERLEISKTKDWDKNLNKFNVIRIDVGSFFSSGLSISDSVKVMEQTLLDDIRR